MASKISGSRKLKKSSLPKFEADVYSKLPSGELIVFAVHYLMEHKIEITLDDIVSICFLLFPHKFGLKKYPKWPDSALVGRRWGDTRRKGFIVANTHLGYKLTSKGSSLVKKVEKVLGLATPRPVAKAHSTHLREKSLTPAPAVIQKKIRSVRAKRTSSAPVKQTQTPGIQMHPVLQGKKVQPVQEEKVTQLELIPIRAKKISSVPAPMKQAVHVSTPAKKKQPIQPAKTQAKNVKPMRVKETKSPEPVIIGLVKKAEKTNYAVPGNVTREAKERAGKFARMMERSDAYIDYKKNGSNSKISEFDFRSLLLCTMESSAETLAGNVELFKRYAAIRHRQDLIVFLFFCESKFSYLLKPQQQAAKKLKK